MIRGIVDKKGEQFAYIENGVLFTVDGERSGTVTKDFILDLAGNKIWRVVGAGVYTLDGNQSIGFIMGEKK
jgi:hypothetical protein